VPAILIEVAMSLRVAVLSLISGLCALPAVALCTGDSLLDRLTPAERARLDTVAAATPFAEGLFWTATRGDTTLTLIGTMHIHDPRHDALRDTVAAAVRGADLVLVEATPQEEAEMQAAMAADPGIMLITEGPTLIDQLDAATWAQISEALLARQIPPFMAAKFQPWFLMLNLSVPPCAMPDLAAGKRGLDHIIMDIAAQAQVPLQPLEPWETLIEVFATGTPAEQIDLLRMGLLPPEIEAEVFVALLDGYFAGRVAEVWELSHIALDYVPGLDPAEAEVMFAETEALLLTGRNKAWIPVIKAAADGRGQVVVAVGAAHLPGDAGVLRLLEAEGWTVSPFAQR
jgi:uncharacterized protein YbaP (TraB family)